MTCTEARAILLTAAPAELTGQVEGPLASHLRACAECRAAASLVLAAERDLAAALEATRSDPDHAGSRALAVARAGRTGHPWRWTARWVPLAAAAGLLLLLTQTRPAPEPPPQQPPRPPSPRTPTSLSLEVDVRTPAGRTTAIFRTPNPDIVVVWFF